MPHEASINTPEVNAPQTVKLDDNNNIQPFDYDAFEAERDKKRAPANLDFKVLWEQQRDENKVLQASLDALSMSRTAPVSSSNARAAVTYEQLEGKLGVAGLNKLSADQVAVAVGLSSTPSDAEILKYFGPHADTRDPSLLIRQDPQRYRMMREFGRIRRII